VTNFLYPIGRNQGGQWNPGERELMGYQAVSRVRGSRSWNLVGEAFTTRSAAVETAPNPPIATSRCAARSTTLLIRSVAFNRRLRRDCRSTHTTLSKSIDTFLDLQLERSWSYAAEHDFDLQRAPSTSMCPRAESGLLLRAAIHTWLLCQIDPRRVIVNGLRAPTAVRLPSYHRATR